MNHLTLERIGILRATCQLLKFIKFQRIMPNHSIMYTRELKITIVLQDHLEQQVAPELQIKIGYLRNRVTDLKDLGPSLVGMRDQPGAGDAVVRTMADDASDVLVRAPVHQIVLECRAPAWLVQPFGVENDQRPDLLVLAVRDEYFATG